MSSATGVRAVYAAVRAPGAAPFDTIHVKVHYPASATGSDDERLTGVIPAATDRAPFPLVLLLNGINVDPAGYGWLAQRIALEGFAVATWSWVGPLMPGYVGLTPGVDITGASPDTYGTRPTGTGITPVIEACAGLNGDGPLRGLLDLDRLILGGHSAGGTMVLQNCRRAYFPTLVAAFSYAAHNLAAEPLGHEPGAVLPVVADCPLLVMGGTDDGVIAQSVDRYKRAEHVINPIVQTFDEGVATSRGDCYLAMLLGANHMSMLDPDDPTTARGFLDTEPALVGPTAREFLGDLIIAFLGAHVRNDSAGQDDLERLLSSPILAVSRRR